MPRNASSQLDWRDLKPLLWELWKEEGATIKSLQTQLEERRGLSISRTRLHRQLLEWGWRRNLSAKEWKVVELHVQKRKQQDGKDSEVRLNGIALRNVDHKPKRHRLSLIEQIELKNNPKPLPPDITVNTPEPVTEAVVLSIVLPCSGLIRDLRSVFAVVSRLSSRPPVSATSKPDTSDIEKQLERIYFASDSVACENFAIDIHELVLFLNNVFSTQFDSVDLFIGMYNFVNNLDNSRQPSYREFSRFLALTGASEDLLLFEKLADMRGPAAQMIILAVLDEVVLADNIAAAQELFPPVRELINLPYKSASLGKVLFEDTITSQEMMAVFTANGGIAQTQILVSVVDPDTQTEAMLPEYRTLYISKSKRVLADPAWLEMWREATEENQNDNWSIDQVWPFTTLPFRIDTFDLALETGVLRSHEIALWYPHHEQREAQMNWLLAFAASEGFIQSLKGMIRHGRPLNRPVTFAILGQLARTATPLQYAICAGQWECVDALLDANASMISENYTHYALSTPLKLALLHGNVALSRRLVLQGADVRRRPKTSDTLFLAALSNGHIVDQECSYLTLAARLGITELVDELIRAGADPLEALPHGWKQTPLTAALEIQDQSMFECLVRHGCQIDTPLHPRTYPQHLKRPVMSGLVCAVRSGLTIPLTWITPLSTNATQPEDHGRVTTPLTAAIETEGVNHDHEYISELIALGADVNSCDARPSPLAAAANRRCSTCIDILMARGVSAYHGETLKALISIGDAEFFNDFVRKAGGTSFFNTEACDPICESLIAALDLVTLDNGKMFQVVLGHVQLPHICSSSYCMTAVLEHAAALNTSHSKIVELVKCLIDLGVPVESMVDEGERTVYDVKERRSALWLAIEQENIELVELLLKHHAKTNVIHKAGFSPLDICFEEMTPIHRAAQVGKVRIMKLLIAAGGSVHDARGDSYHRWQNTVLEGAVRLGKFSMVRYLLNEQKVDANELLNRSGGRAPLEVAAICGHLAVALELLRAGANINAGEFLVFMSPLEGAAMRGRVDMVQLLLSSGANIGPSDIGKRRLDRAIDLATSHGFPVVAKMLRDHK